jgi:hypothetical protein
MSRLGPDSRALFRGARRELAPDDADRKRVGRALALKLGVAAATVSGTASSAAAVAGAGATSAGAASTGAGALALATTAKWISVVVLVGAAGAIGAGAISARPPATAAPPPRGQSAPSRALSPAPLPSSRAPVVGPVVHPDAVPSVRPAPRPLSRPLARSDTPATAPRTAIADETRLLRLADEAMRRGDARAALGLLEEHAALFPAGVLSEERSAERASVLCVLGRDAEARGEADRFVRTFPGSPLTDRVRSTCAEAAAPAQGGVH